MNIFTLSLFTTFDVDYHDKSALMNWNLCLAIKHPSDSTVKNWLNEFNSGCCSLKNEIREGRPKTATVSENIDAVCELIMQDRHVSYREIEASLGCYHTNIQSILHEHRAVKNFCSRLIPHNLTIVQKRIRVDGWKEKLAKYDRGA